MRVQRIERFSGGGLKDNIISPLVATDPKRLTFVRIQLWIIEYIAFDLSVIRVGQRRACLRGRRYVGQCVVGISGSVGWMLAMSGGDEVGIVY